MTKVNLKLAFKLTGDFKKNLNKRSSIFLSYNALPKILEWSVLVWRKDMELLGKGQDTLELWSEYSQLLMQLDGIFSDLENMVLTNNTMDVYDFFHNLEIHTTKYKDEKEKVKDKDERFYVEHLLQVFYRDFFNKVDDSPNRYHIWKSYFPDSWKIRSSTVLNNVFQRITLSEFLQWTAERISKAKDKDFDRALNEASEELFPEVDPIWWSAILILTLSPYDPNARIKYVIEMPWTFGLGERIRVLDGYAENTPENEAKQMAQIRSLYAEDKKQTVEMVRALMKIVPIFDQTFHPSKLSGLKEQIVALKYEDKSKEEMKRLRLLQILDAISDPTNKAP